MISMRRATSRDGASPRGLVSVIGSLAGQVRGGVQAPLASVKSDLFGRDRQRLAALGRVDDAHGHGLTFHEAGHARGTEHRDVHEHVLATVIGLDEAEALVLVEPLYLAG